MRQDISKVICERPRLLASDEATRVSRRNWRQNPNDDMTFIGMKKIHKIRHGYNTKELNENLRPLCRFLGSRCGKKWNDVYSEICANLSKNSAIQLHVFQHLDHMVEKNTQIINGEICDSKGKILYRGFRDMYYVDSDGILQRLVKVPKRNYNRNSKSGTYDGTNIKYIRSDDPFIDYCLINGVWYEITFREWDGYSYYDILTKYRTVSDYVYDYTTKKYVFLKDKWWNKDKNRYTCKINGKVIYRAVVKKRQLNSKEIRQKVA